MKKFLLLLLSLACMLSCVFAFAACGNSKEDLSQYLGTDEELSAMTPTDDKYFVYAPVTSELGTEGYEISLNPELSEEELSAVEVWVIPGSHDGKPVVQIAENAFAAYESPLDDETYESTAEVYVQPGVERVCTGGLYPGHGSCFAVCQLPSTCKVLEKGALYTSDLRAGTGLAVIKEDNHIAFAGPVCFPDSLEYCAASLTAYTDTEKATIEEDGVNYVGNPNNPHMIAFSYELGKSGANVVLNENCKIVQSELFKGYTKSIALPENLTHIGASAFRNTGITVLDIPDSVKYIENYAFGECSLTQVSLPDSAVYIATDAFGDASQTLPGTEYGRCIYLGTSSNPYYYLLRAKAYEDLDPTTDTTGYIIHENTKIIAENAFINASLVWSYDNSQYNYDEMIYEALSVTVPDGVIAIGEKALNSTDHYLVSISMPGNWPYLHDDIKVEADSAKPLSYFTGVLCTMKDDGKGETSVTIRDGYTTVEQYAFGGLGYLDELILPSSVTAIAYGAFSQSWVGSTHYDTTVYTLTAPYVPAARANSPCATATLLNDCGAKHLILAGDVTEIGVNAFRYCENLESITFPESLTLIGNTAFMDSTKVTNVTFLGTQEQWEVVEKGSYWLPSSAEYEMIYGK